MSSILCLQPLTRRNSATTGVSMDCDQVQKGAQRAEIVTAEVRLLGRTTTKHLSDAQIHHLQRGCVGDGIIIIAKSSYG